MLYLLLVYTIPVSEFLDVVPNSDVSKSVTSSDPIHFFVVLKTARGGSGIAYKPRLGSAK